MPLRSGDPRLQTHPFVLGLMVLLLISGLGSAFADAKPGSVEQVLPWWASLIWGCIMAAGSAIALAGVIAQMFKRMRGLILEMNGSIIMAATLSFYALCVGIYARFSGLLVISMAVLFMCLAVWNAWRIHSVLRDARLIALARSRIVIE